MPHARVLFELPGGPGTISRAYPNDEFRLLATRRTAAGLRVLLEGRTSNADAIIRDLDGIDWLLNYEVLHRDEQTLLVEYDLQSLPSLYHAILDSGHLLQFPLELRDGWLASDMLTSHERLSKLKAVFEGEGIPYEISSVTQTANPAGLLTDRQRQVVTEAIGRGYYDSPRQCSLTELAAELGINKSAASGILHRAEGRIIKSSLGRPEA